MKREKSKTLLFHLFVPVGFRFVAHNKCALVNRAIKLLNYYYRKIGYRLMMYSDGALGRAVLQYGYKTG